MNFLTLGMRTLKLAEKAKLEALQYNDKMGKIVRDPNEEFLFILDRERERVEQALEIGLQYHSMARERIGNATASSRWYMLTVRPPPGTNFATLKNSTEKFINKWQDGWADYEYCFEQKGTCEKTIGNGCHTHIIFEAQKKNYYPSHIIRDAQKAWPYVKANCIQVDTLRNVLKAKEYIRGGKAPEKLEAVEWDKIWRKQIGVDDVIVKSGQVHPLLTIN